ncbi:hypothetical protein HAX54_022934 [Datura stramonium]|uniref:Uncharacterized protein n=1 Tax=Datura stramonium TaxID=4076 RepID=A0ABS8UXC6_DATST|nr:hypothetical protein [Datura stramonium]
MEAIMRFYNTMRVQKKKLPVKVNHVRTSNRSLRTVQLDKALRLKVWEGRILIQLPLSEYLLAALADEYTQVNSPLHSKPTHSATTSNSSNQKEPPPPLKYLSIEEVIQKIHSCILGS